MAVPFSFQKSTDHCISNLKPRNVPSMLFSLVVFPKPKTFTENKRLQWWRSFYQHHFYNLKLAATVRRCSFFTRPGLQEPGGVVAQPSGEVVPSFPAK